MTRRTLSVVAAVVLAAAALVTPATAAAAQSGGSELADVEVDRLRGADRYETSLRIAEAFAEGAGGTVGDVVMVSGRHWTDAVVAASFASRLGAPVLMTPPGELRDDALEFLKRVGAEEVHIVAGGVWPDTNVSPQVFTQLREAGITPFGTHGPDQYSVGVAIARWLGQPGSLSRTGRSAIIANGEVFADALVAGPLSYKSQVPVLLTPRDELHSEVADYLRDSDTAHVVLMGGTAALSKDVEAAIRRLGITNVDRMAGASRFETATKTARYAADKFAADSAAPGCFGGSSVGLARARIPFDSLGAAPLLAQRCAPLVLTDPAKVPTSTVEYLDTVRSNAARDVDLVVFGGNAAVSKKSLDAYLAAGAAEADTDDEDEPTAPAFVAVSAGGTYTCALRNDQTIACWGDNSRGQTDAPSGTFTSVAAGAFHACAVRTDKTVTCWGRNVEGQLNAPSGTFSAVSAGWVHTCGLRTDGTATCWGSSELGQLAAPSGTFTALFAANRFACGLRSDGSVKCWGRNNVEQLDVPSEKFSEIAATADVPCGLRADGKVICWGQSTLAVVAAVPPSEPLTTITVGLNHACGLARDGWVHCWGSGDSPQQVTPLSPFASLGSTGFYHICGVRPDGTITCWGQNDHGQTDAPAP